PTYPGELDSKKKEYTLNYPGISFVFPIPEEHISFYTSSSGMTDLPMELPDGTSPLLSRLYTFHGSSFLNAIAPPLHRNKNSDGIGSGLLEFEVESVVAELKRRIIVNFLNNSNNATTEIVLNVTTPQDLLVDIGSPLRTFFKEEDKMRIHSEDSSTNYSVESGDNGDSNSSPNVEDRSRGGDAIDYFYNYFHLGFDVLFDGSTHRCKKIVLHGNVPGHFDFQRYKRCPYKILLPKVSSNSQISNEVAKLEVLEDDDNQSTSQSPQIVDDFITSEMKMDQIRDLLGHPSGHPLIFNRGAGGQNPFGPTKLSGYDGVVFEEMKNGCVATITLF
ncbi:4756_t:CDS:2, partial [Funneliformis caledonium]